MLNYVCYYTVFSAIINSKEGTCWSRSSKAGSDCQEDCSTRRQAVGRSTAAHLHIHKIKAHITTLKEHIYQQYLKERPLQRPHTSVVLFTRETKRFTVELTESVASSLLRLSKQPSAPWDHKAVSRVSESSLFIS